jgi:alpha-L-fucosidase
MRTTAARCQQWHWGGGASCSGQGVCDKFFNRTRDLIDNYDPDLVYYDDTVLPLWPVSDVGLRLAAHMYNRSIATKGKLEAVVNGKILNDQQRHSMVWDIERGQSDRIEPLALADLHLHRQLALRPRVYDNKAYKSAQTVVHTLIDVVSKNGNLLLSVPVRGNGTIDEQERAIVEEIGRWMAVNSEAIYDTRPWAVFGEGPVMAEAPPMSGAGLQRRQEQAVFGRRYPLHHQGRQRVRLRHGLACGGRGIDCIHARRRPTPGPAYRAGRAAGWWT